MLNPARTWFAVLAAIGCATGSGCAPPPSTAPTSVSTVVVTDLVPFSGAVVDPGGRPIDGNFVIYGTSVVDVSIDATGAFSGRLRHRPGGNAEYRLQAERGGWEGPPVSVTVANGVVSPSPILIKRQAIEMLDRAQGPVRSTVPLVGLYGPSSPFRHVHLTGWLDRPIQVSVTAAANTPLQIRAEASDTDQLPKDYPYERMPFDIDVATTLLGDRQVAVIQFPKGFVEYAGLTVSSARPMPAAVPFEVTPVE